MTVTMEAPPAPDAHKDVAALLEDALHATGLTQYKLAQRLAKMRPCAKCEGDGEIVPFGRRKAVPCQACGATGRSHTSSQDQQLRRIRRFGQLPTEEYAADMARAFAPDLDLPRDYFFTPRESVHQFREQAMEALSLLPELRERVEALEAELLARDKSRRDA